MNRAPISALADKIRRALRNKTSTQFSNDELRLLAEQGVLHRIAEAEADEIMAAPGSRQMIAQPAASPDVYSVRTLAERWQCSEGLVRKMISSGQLESFRYGNLIRIRQEAVARVEEVRPPKKGGAMDESNHDVS
jgi:excisionase family DNA binding protein